MTNGIMINDKNVKALVDNIHIFNISIETVDEESCSCIRGKGIYLLR
jgi:MoaA/NifB/PqqE/SkfB family radical SAM enzyme